MGTSAVVVVLLLGLMSAPGPAAPTDQALVVVISSADYDNFDPHKSAFEESYFVFMNIFDPLLWLGPDLKIYPGLATEWRSEDGGRAWVLKLRKDVKFHDGSRFNAQVAKFNFDRMANPANKGRAFELLGPYAGTEVIDNYTIRVKFKSAHALFPYNLTLSFMSMVSMEAVKKFGNDQFVKHLIGTGPFRFVREVLKVETTLEVNPAYNWGPSFAKHKGPARFRRLVFRFIAEDETRLITLRSGQAHIIEAVPPAAVKGLRESKDFAVHVIPRYGIARSLHFNVDLPPTSDIALRRAVVHAIDRVTLAKAVLQSVYPVSYTFLVPATKYYDKSLESKVAYDPELAKRILEEGGWKLGADGVREKDGRKARIFTATFPGFQAEAPLEFVQAALKEIGIQLDIRVMTGEAMLEGMAKRASTFNAAFIGWYDPDPTLVLYRFYSSKNANISLFSHYSSPELDALLNTAGSTVNEAEKERAIKQIQRIVVDNALAAALYANAAVYAARSTVKNIAFDPRAHPLLYDVQLTGR
jgi:peptide/nickel transport system substrate-binding protein